MAYRGIQNTCVIFSLIFTKITRLHTFYEVSKYYKICNHKNRTFSGRQEKYRVKTLTRFTSTHLLLNIKKDLSSKKCVNCQ